MLHAWQRSAQSDSEDAGVYFFTGLSRAEKSNAASGTWSGRTRWARWLRSQESTREEGKPCVGRKTSSCAFLTAASKITPDGPGPPSAALGMAVRPHGGPKRNGPQTLATAPAVRAARESRSDAPGALWFRSRKIRERQNQTSGCQGPEAGRVGGRVRSDGDFQVLAGVMVT